ncbi:hypothetical protein TSOC_010363, partial [Tetrabaena socialis]
ASPACSAAPTPFNSFSDTGGRRWGSLTAHDTIATTSSAASPPNPDTRAATCAFKDQFGSPIFTWETAPRCLEAPSVFSARADSEGRLWGEQYNLTCAFKAADSDRPLYDFLTAPACTTPPETVTSESDVQGRLWGWEAGRECAYKGTDNAPLALPLGADLSAVQPVTPEQMVARGSVPTAASISWRAAPRCAAPPTKGSSTMDSRGRLWGWQDAASCAFKDGLGAPVYDWDTAPRCLGDVVAAGEAGAAEGQADQTVEAAGEDGARRLWGWEAGGSCAFKDLMGRPLRTWATAVRCPTAPQLSTAVPDDQFRLWGWLADALGGGSCAFQDATGVALTLGSGAAASAPAAGLQLADGRGGAAASALPASEPEVLPAAGPQGTVGLINAALTQQAAADAAADANATSSSVASSDLGPVPVPIPIPGSADQPSTKGSLSPAPASPATAQIDAAKPSLEPTADAQATREPADGSGSVAAVPAPSVAGRAGTWTASRASHRAVAHLRSVPLARLRPDHFTPFPNRPSLTQIPALLRVNTRIWGNEGGLSCVYRTSDGQPAGLWDVAPACVGAAGQGGAGRSWGWENGRSCALRVSSSYQPTPSAQPEVHTDPAGPWASAPICTAGPTPDNSKRDSSDRPWGWENGRSCAFRGAAAATTAQVTATASAVATASTSTAVAAVATAISSSMPATFATGDVHTAPGCRGQPTMGTSQPDSVGYLWGWQDGGACVFRGSDGKPVYYAALITGDWSAQPGYVLRKPSDQATWFDAPRCAQPPTWAAKPDSEGRLWGYEAGQGCVYRDARGYPLFYSDLQNGQTAQNYNKGSKWDNAPTCPDAPSWSTARADKYGRLWGWNGLQSTACAYKDAAGSAVYPPKL